MEGMYGLQSRSSRGGTYAPPPPAADSLNMLALQLQDGGSNNNYQNLYAPFDATFGLYDSTTTNHHHHHNTNNNNNIFPGSSVISDADSMVIADGEDDDSRSIRSKIAAHPLYPKLLEAYIECQKVGAPPEIAGGLDAIRRESNVYAKTVTTGGSTSSDFGADPELDEFMETYCDILVKYKLDLSRPFEEAMSFLNKTENQLLHLCNGSSKNFASDEGVMSSEEDLSSGGEIDALECMQSNEDRELKDKLLQKYSGYISALKQEFSKKKKKGKLPKESREMLLNWWNLHYKWPYPTEADKVALAESTGLDQKQINNWFINQRKRHWKPSENMQFGVMESLYGPFFMSD